MPESPASGSRRDRPAGPPSWESCGLAGRWPTPRRRPDPAKDRGLSVKPYAVRAAPTAPAPTLFQLHHHSATGLDALQQHGAFRHHALHPITGAHQLVLVELALLAQRNL